MTVHEDAIKRAYEQAIQDPKMAARVGATRQALSSGAWWSSEYVTPMGQPGRGWAPHQAWAFCQLHAESKLGHLARMHVQVGSTPSPDAERRANAAALANLEEGLFKAHVDLTQNGAECDGEFEWTEPVELACPGRPTLSIAPRRMPLEIGSCLPSRVLLHLQEYGAVARWPYGQSEVTVLLRVTGGDELRGITRVTTKAEETRRFALEIKDALELLDDRGLEIAASFLGRAFSDWTTGKDFD